ncbi:MAG: AI-2E family transporter [Lachnospiraceae bacterium]|nr:AI-2E family transporter [Lachnospiraceae bacterium]
MFKNRDWMNKGWGPYTVAACAAVLLFMVLSHLSFFISVIGAFCKFVKPVFFGVVIAYVLNPLVVIFQKKVFKNIKSERVSHLISAVVVLVLVILFIVVLMIALVPQIISSVMTLIKNIGLYSSTINKYFSHLNQYAGSKNMNISSMTGRANEVINAILDKLPTNGTSIVNTSYHIGQGLFDWIVGFILAIYFLMDSKRNVKGVQNFVHLITGEKNYGPVAAFVARCHHILIRFVACELIDALIIGFANFIFMKASGMPYEVLISTIVGVTNLAPTFGPIVGGVIGAFILVLIKPWWALAFIIFTLCLQTMDGYVIKPKLFGNTLGVPGVWILIFIIVGGRMFGVWGILFAIPVAAIISFIYHDIVSVRVTQFRENKKEKNEQ